MTIEFGNAQIICSKPFTIGQIPMMLDQSTIRRVRSDIATWFAKNNSSVSVSREQKFKIDTKKDRSLFQDFVNRSSSTTIQVMDTLQSPALRHRILKKIWFQTIVNRKDRYSLELALLGLANVDCFETRIELSVMGKDSSIVPHTDSVGKIFSGLIYLPTEQQAETSTINSLGTSFWHSQIKNYTNRHLSNKSDQDNFYDSAELIMQNPFESGAMWFFLRNDRSWHSVEKLKFLESEDKRVSVNYNILLRGSILKRVSKDILRKFKIIRD